MSRDSMDHEVGVSRLVRMHVVDRMGACPTLCFLYWYLVLADDEISNVIFLVFREVLEADEVVKPFWDLVEVIGNVRLLRVGGAGA